MKRILICGLPGSGKTTLIEYIVNNMSNKNILVLCYNRMLMNNTFNKLYMLDNVNCNTFHSFGLKYYNSKCITDEGILTILRNNSKKTKYNIFDLIIIDECQDMTKWELTDYISNKFNRLILYDASMFHKSLDYFGKDKYNGRLFQVFFFNTEINTID